MIGKQISHYKIIEKLGEGGMGVVYKAEDTKLDRLVALKFLPSHLSQSEEEQKRFIHEAKAASALDHPNICTVHEIDETEDGQMFIAMACYEGVSLKDKIKDHPPSSSTLRQAQGDSRDYGEARRLKIKEAVDITIQIAQGLARAHEEGIVHRDIKPANIIVTDRGEVKILDFGLAKLAGRSMLTKEGTTLGTVSYMSPEQSKGDLVDQRTDIWSLGVVIYEMITGEQPFKGDYEQAVIYSILNDEPEPMTGMRSGVPMEMERIVNKAMAKNSGERYQHIDEMVIDLKTIRKQLESGTQITQPAREKLPGKKRAYWYGSITGLFVLMIIALLNVFPGDNEAIDSIAVLPLSNLSGDPEQEYFVDGMTEALTAELSKISVLRVISRTSAMQYKGARKSLPQIAHELNVDALIEGSVLKEGNKVRITVQLIRAVPEQQLWAEGYLRDLQDILTLQKEVARAIVHKIKIKLTPAEEANLKITKSINPKAYEMYLLGRFFIYTATSESIQKGIEYFQKSLEIDTSCALSYSGLADAYTTLGNYGLHQPYETFPKAKEFAIKALEIDETLAEAHTQLGYIKMDWDWDWAGAEKAFKRAIELNPGYSYTYMLYAAYFSALGRFDQAIKTMNRAIELDPLSILYNTLLGYHLNYAGRYVEAIAQLRKTLEMNPDFAEAHYYLGMVHEQKKMYQEAIAEFQKSIRLSKGVTMYIASLGHAHALSGNRSEALKILDELLELSRQQYVSSYEIAVIYTGLGEKDQAIARLNKAFEQRDGWLSFYLKVDPRLDTLRLDPGFISILKNIGLE